jgi:hypothetical protein
VFKAIIIVLLFAACENKRNEEPVKQETPKALKDNSTSYEIVSNRSYDDLVESLYNELVSKNIDLKKLEDQIESLNESRNDSTKFFDKFHQKNESYYSAANKHVAAINDSLLKVKMSRLISDNSTKYNASIDRHKYLLSSIEANNMSIGDLHNMLKIVKTLPLIEQYQRSNLPGTKSLQGYIQRQNQTIKFADSLIEK